MNRRRNEIRQSSMVYIALSLGAAFSALGGIMHVNYKNQQINTNREIDAAESRIEQARLDIRTSEMHMDHLLNRFTMRTQLARNGSNLKPISLSSVEKVTPTNPNRRDMASAAP